MRSHLFCVDQGGPLGSWLPGLWAQRLLGPLCVSTTGPRADGRRPVCLLAPNSDESWEPEGSAPTLPRSLVTLCISEPGPGRELRPVCLAQTLRPQEASGPRGAQAWPQGPGLPAAEGLHLPNPGTVLGQCQG